MDEKSVGFLLLKSSRVVSRLYQKQLAEHGITPPQSSIIALLGKKKELYQTEIGLALNLDKANASIMLHRMCKDGLLKYRDDAKDRRKVVYSLSPKGQKLVPIIHEVDQRVNQLLTDTLGPRLTDQTAKILNDLYSDEKLR